MLLRGQKDAGILDLKLVFSLQHSAVVLDSALMFVTHSVSKRQAFQGDLIKVTG